MDPISAIPLTIALAALFFYALYIVVRAAVRDGIKQASEAAKPPVVEGAKRAEPTPLGG